MSINPFFKQTLISACIVMGLSSLASAGLTINEPSSAKIAWGNSDSLSQARTIMYADNSASKQQSGQSADIRRVDKGGVTTLTTVNNGNYGYPTSQVHNGNIGASLSNDTLPIATASEAVLVMDVASNAPLYEKNANIARPIASISKLMTAMVILDAGQDMREEIMLDPIDFVGPKHASSRLKAGDRMNRAELLLLMLMKSENPAAKTLARSYPGGYDSFMLAMNRKAQSLGMTSTFFGDPTGLDKRNVASPMDLVKMVKAAGSYEVIRRFSTTKNYDFFVANYSAGNRTLPATNTSYLVRDGGYPIGISKTGYINESGKCVVMETRINNRPAIIVILGAKSSSNRWDDAETILDGLSLRRTI